METYLLVQHSYYDAVKVQGYMVEGALVDVVFVVVVVDDIDFHLQAMVYYVMMDSSLLGDDNDYYDSNLAISCY